MDSIRNEGRPVRGLSGQRGARVVGQKQSVHEVADVGGAAKGANELVKTIIHNVGLTEEDVGAAAKAGLEHGKGVFEGIQSLQMPQMVQQPQQFQAQNYQPPQSDAHNQIRQLQQEVQQLRNQVAQQNVPPPVRQPNPQQQQIQQKAQQVQQSRFMNVGPRSPDNMVPAGLEQRGVRDLSRGMSRAAGRILGKKIR
jgi:hypothetical protein